MKFKVTNDIDIDTDTDTSDDVQQLDAAARAADERMKKALADRTRELTSFGPPANWTIDQFERVTVLNGTVKAATKASHDALASLDTYERDQRWLTVKAPRDALVKALADSIKGLPSVVVGVTGELAIDDDGKASVSVRFATRPTSTESLETALMAAIAPHVKQLQDSDLLRLDLGIANIGGTGDSANLVRVAPMRDKATHPARAPRASNGQRDLAGTFETHATAEEKAQLATITANADGKSSAAVGSAQYALREKVYKRVNPS